MKVAFKLKFKLTFWSSYRKKLFIGIYVRAIRDWLISNRCLMPDNNSEEWKTCVKWLPPLRFELVTFRPQVQCSTTELSRHLIWSSKNAKMAGETFSPWLSREDDNIAIFYASRVIWGDSPFSGANIMCDSTVHLLNILYLQDQDVTFLVVFYMFSDYYTCGS